MLETKKVGDYTVSQAGMRQAIRRMRLLQIVMDAKERKLYDDDTISGLMLYPNIAGALHEDMTIEEYLNIPETVLDELTNASMELNPHWYGNPQQEKKTEPPQTESTSE